VVNLTELQVRRLANVDQVIASIREAFARDYSATLRMPVRTCLELADGSVLLLMPSYDSALGMAGVKTVTVSKETGVNAAYELIDPRSGRILARMAANWLTDVRTAATSATATDLLARSDVETLGVFGCGRQAVAHLTVLSHVRSFRKFLACGTSRASIEELCGKMKSEYGLEVTAVDAERCVREADVLCTCTTSGTPVFDGRWLRPGTHLNLVGAFQPDTREVDDETMKRARIFVDTDHALAEAGDLLIPLKNGAIRREHVLGGLHEIASGKKHGRTSDDEVTLFKGVGCALEDLVTAELVYRLANQRKEEHRERQ
jgi:alanine dehydrogenase